MALNQVSAVPAGVLRVISDVILTYNRTFSNREPIPFSKAHTLSYTHSKVGNNQMHIRGEMTSGKLTLSGFVRSRRSPYGDLKWIFVPYACIFEGGPHHFQKAHALRYRHRKFGNDGVYFRGEWALRRWHWIKFQWYRLGCKGWFQLDFIPQPVRFRKGPVPFSECTCPQVWAQKVWGWSDVYSRRMGT